MGERHRHRAERCPRARTRTRPPHDQVRIKRRHAHTNIRPSRYRTAHSPCRTRRILARDAPTNLPHLSGRRTLVVRDHMEHHRRNRRIVQTVSRRIGHGKRPQAQFLKRYELHRYWPTRTLPSTSMSLFHEPRAQPYPQRIHRRRYRGVDRPIAARQFCPDDHFGGRSGGSRFFP